MTKKITSLGLFLIFAVTSYAQAGYISKAVEIFSRKKTAYVTLKDGTELSGTIKDLDRKKGLFEQITLADEKKKKTKIDAEDISHMYLPQNSLDKMNATLDKMYDAQQWDAEDINMEHLKEGYAYFEQSTIQLKKKQVDVLLQLLNPAFADPVRIYFDPYAKETASVGIGGVALAGGDDKSYWIKVGDEVAFKLKKKDYDENYQRIYAKCPDYIKELGDKPLWRDFGEQLYNYAQSCK